MSWLFYMATCTHTNQPTPICRLSGGHIAGIAVVSVTLVAIAVTVGICIYKKKCSTTGKTGPSHLSGNVQQLSLCMRKPTVWVPTRSDTNRSVRSQKMVRGWKFCIEEVEELY